MASLNKVQLIGNLGRDPEVRYMPNGTATATISMATSERWKDKESGEAREAVEWHRIVFFRGLAEVVGKYLKQGAPVYVEGKMKTRKWQDKDGQDRYTTEVQAAELIMLGSRPEPSAVWTVSGIATNRSQTTTFRSDAMARLRRWPG